MKPSDFSGFLTRYLTHYLPIQRNLSGNTIKSYRDTFKLLLAYCRDERKLNIAKLSLKHLDKRCIEEFVVWLRQSRESSPATCNQRLSAIRAFFDYVMTEEPAHMEQCQKIIKIRDMDSPEHPAKYLTASNLQSLLNEPDTSTKQGRRHLTILTVLYDTAARVSELADVKIRDVRLDTPASITFVHGKGDKMRTVPLMKQTVSLLDAYFTENRINPRIQGDLPLFFNTRRKKLTRSGITYIVQKYANVVNHSSNMPPKITPHILRHTKAMHLVQANVHPIYIRDYLGHADITTTEVYARADNETKREALEAAAERLQLPQSSDWEQDTGLIEWLSSLG